MRKSKRFTALLLVPACFAFMLMGLAQPEAALDAEPLPGAALDAGPLPVAALPGAALPVAALPGAALNAGPLPEAALEAEPLPGEHQPYTSLEDIPGITEHEINAIKELRESGGPFVYAMPLNIEAYRNENGEIRGFSHLFCNWLTELTGLPLEIALYDWEDLVNDLGSIREPGSAKISFTGEMTVTEARRDIYHMTEPIAHRPLKAFRIEGATPFEEIAETRLLRCGFMRGASTIAIVTAEMEPGTYKLLEFDSYSEVYSALKEGAIDAFYYSAPAEFHFLEYPDVAVFDFYPLIFMPVSLSTADPRLEPVISVVDKALSAGAGSHLATLYTQAYNEYLRYKVSKQLTEAERRLPLLISLSVLLACVLVLVVLLWFKTRRSRERAESLVRERTKELSMRTTMLAAFFDSIPDLVFVKDLNLRYIECNKSLQEYFGKTKEEIIGSADIGIEALYGTENNKRVLENGEALAFEEFVPRADGALLLHETVQAPLIVDGAVVGVLGVARNINDRKEMEEAALAASRSKSAFLANMSHEVRTPMNSIMGFAEFALSDEDISPETRDSLEKLLQSSEMLLQIINDVLDLSDLESGKLELESTPFDLGGIFDACRDVVAPEAEEKGLITHIEAEPLAGTRLYGDPARLSRVLLNLLSNAVKFTDNGMVRMSASVKDKHESSVTIHFEVKDSGIGMTHEEIEQVFEPFAQVESGATRKHGGSGLGLALAKNIIRQMGGELAVESVRGVGSKFFFDIAFAAGEAEPGGKECKFDPRAAEGLRSWQGKEANRAAQKPEVPDLSHAAVLVVDNFETNLEVAAKLLSKYKLRVDCAISGFEAIERIGSGSPKYDIVFMDHMMPGMDGIEALERIRALGTRYAETVPIIALTANALAGNDKMFMDKGFSDFLAKPVSARQMDAAVRKWIPGAEAAPAAPEPPAEPEPAPEPKPDPAPQPMPPAEPAPAPPAEAIKIPGINAKLGLMLYDGDAEMLADIIETFAESIPAELEKLRSVTKENLAGYAGNAHTIKGSAASIGAKDLADKAKEMEMTAKAGNLEGVLAENEAFINQTQTLLDDITTWLSKATNPNASAARNPKT